MKTLSTFADGFIRQSLAPSKEFGPLVLAVDHALLGRTLADYRISKEVEATAVARKMRKTKGAVYFLERGLNKWDRKKVERYLLIVTRLARRNGKLTHPQVLTE